MRIKPHLIRILRECSVALLAVLFLLGTGLTEARAEYGDDAYAFMKTLQERYPGRATNTDQVKNARDFLVNEVRYMGYEDVQIQSYTTQTPNGDAVAGDNIIFEKPGTGSKVIVVGAHYDSVAQTNGTDDNASGVGVLLELANRFSAKASPEYTIRFILFCDEEPGCLGSSYYVSVLPAEEISRIACMVNIDTIGAGDRMYLYGGGLDEAGAPVRYWAVRQALEAAQQLGLPMSYHPDLSTRYPVPVKHTASDQAAFNNAGIPYVYCEASLWTNDTGQRGPNFYQTDNPAAGDGQMMHKPECENLAFYESTFGSRFLEHQRAYTRLVEYFIDNFHEESDGEIFPMRQMQGEAIARENVRIRAKASTATEILGMIEGGNSCEVTGYNDEWCRVVYQGVQGYIKTSFLEVTPPAEPEPQPETEEAVNVITEAEDETDEAENVTDKAEETPDEQEALSGEEEAENGRTGEPEEDESEEGTSSDKGNVPAPVTIPPQRTSEMVLTYGEDQEQLSGNKSNLPGTDASSKLEINIIDLMNDPNAIRILLIAVIAVVCIWVSVLIAMKQRKAAARRNTVDEEDEEDEEEEPEPRSRKQAKKNRGEAAVTGKEPERKRDRKSAKKTEAEAEDEDEEEEARQPKKSRKEARREEKESKSKKKAKNKAEDKKRGKKAPEPEPEPEPEDDEEYFDEDFFDEEILEDDYPEDEDLDEEYSYEGYPDEETADDTDIDVRSDDDIFSKK